MKHRVREKVYFSINFNFKQYELHIEYLYWKDIKELYMVTTGTWNRKSGLKIQL